MLAYPHARGLTRTWLCLALLAAAACSKPKPAPRSPDGYEQLVLRYEGSTGNVTYPELADDLGFLAPLKLEYIGNNATGGPHSIQAVVSGDLDFGSSFNGAIVKLVASKAPLRSVLAGYGTDDKTFAGFYTLPESNVHSARDLIGKQVAMNTLGAHAEFVLREYLVRGGLTPEEIKQVTMLVLPPVNCEQALRAKQVDLVSITTMLRDKASARGELRMLFSDYQLYGPFNAGSFVMSKKFLAANPKTVRKFVQATSDALAWAHAQSREAVVARMKQIIVKRKRLENTDGVQYWRSSGVSTPHAENTAHEHQMWIDWLVRDGQLRPGQVKPSDVFTNEFNSAAGELARAVTYPLFKKRRAREAL